MKYAELSDAERASLQAYMDVHRPLLGEVARVFARIVRATDAFDATVADALAKLDDGAVVETASGLAGAQALTKSQIVGTVGDLKQALGAFYTAEKRQNYIRAAGVANTL